jgi:hypothetical protein
MKFKSSVLPLKKAVVDTGPLFTLLTLVFVRQAPHYRRLMFTKHAPPPYAVANERNYLDFFYSISEVLFTSHVVGEIKSRHPLPPVVFREFWLSSMSYLQQKQVDEKLLALVSLREDVVTSDLVCSVGPVDAGLLALARLENCVLLTDDSRLLSCCDSKGKPNVELVANLFKPSAVSI